MRRCFGIHLFADGCVRENPVVERLRHKG
jgi:hypothetical protein